MSWNLVADIGGTNMRLASVIDRRIANQQTFPTTGELSVEEAMAFFVAAQGKAPQKTAVAAAGIIANGIVHLTNAANVISENGINLACGIDNAKILNDFEAAAWSLANVEEEDTHCLQGSSDLQIAPRVIIGPGTGLGVGALVWDGSRPVVVQGEGGHVCLSPDTDEEIAIFKALCELWPQVRMGDGFAVEAEAIVSGVGLPIFHKAISLVEGLHCDERNAREIFSGAKSGDDMISLKTIRYFSKYLGKVAGDMGVTFAAKGGVFLTGGVVTANQWIFEGDDFLNAFNSGGRHSEFRRSLPVYVYTSGQFGLQGAANYLDYH